MNDIDCKWRIITNIWIQNNLENQRKHNVKRERAQWNKKQIIEDILNDPTSTATNEKELKNETIIYEQQVVAHANFCRRINWLDHP